LEIILRACRSTLAGIARQTYYTGSVVVISIRYFVINYVPACVLSVVLVDPERRRNGRADIALATRTQEPVSFESFVRIVVELLAYLPSPVSYLLIPMICPVDYLVGIS
jgi:hypothetical protein